MSTERKIEISLNLLVLAMTVLINIGVVIWAFAEMRTELDHLHDDVIGNSERIMKLSEHLMKDEE